MQAKLVRDLSGTMKNEPGGQNKYDISLKLLNLLSNALQCQSRHWSIICGIPQGRSFHATRLLPTALDKLAISLLC